MFYFPLNFEEPVYYRLADGFPEPLRDHCLRQLIVISEAPVPEDD